MYNYLATAIKGCPYVLEGTEVHVEKEHQMSPICTIRFRGIILFDVDETWLKPIEGTEHVTGDVTGDSHEQNETEGPTNSDRSTQD